LAHYTGAGVAVIERRLGDRILFALELALEQDDLVVAELLLHALDVTLSRFGGPGAVEHRDLTERWVAAFERLGALRHRHYHERDHQRALHPAARDQAQDALLAPEAAEPEGSQK